MYTRFGRRVSRAQARMAASLLSMRSEEEQGSFSMVETGEMLGQPVLRGGPSA